MIPEKNYSLLESVREISHLLHKLNLLACDIAELPDESAVTWDPGCSCRIPDAADLAIRPFQLN